MPHGSRGCQVNTLRLQRRERSAELKVFFRVQATIPFSPKVKADREEAVVHLPLIFF